MPIIKAKDIAYVQLSAPDLDGMERFLTDFGMVRSDRTESRLYMRGVGTAHHIHVTEQGPSGFIGFAYTACSADDLQTLSKATGAPIEDIDEPGGGRRVRLREPNGFRVDVVHGVAEVEPLPDTISPIRPPGSPVRRKGPARVVRMAHGVLATPKVMETVEWFRNTLGFIPSDDLFVQEPSNIIGSFNRIDAGDGLVDHHVIFCVRNAIAGMHHSSFEVVDPNDIFLGHDYLTAAQYDHMRGIGRHPLGSQIFDYWVSPWNQMHELWSSNERFNAQSGAGQIQVGAGLGHEGGSAPSERFVKQSTPAPA